MSIRNFSLFSRLGVAIFVGKELAVQLRFKLDNRCSNNQAEQLATLRALRVIETTEMTQNSTRIATHWQQKFQ